MPKLHIGSSTVRVEGFLNVDVRRVDGVDVIAHAGRLSSIGDNSVEVIFANAFLEHLFVGQQVPVLREWKRVLAPDGLLIVLGIPDFHAIAELYLAGGPGVIGTRFDLYNVYRYSHGDPEQAGAPADPLTWSRWNPGATADSAPPGWMPQLHKGLFDAQYVHELFTATGWYPDVFAYAWGDEHAVLNLGVVARRGDSSEPADIRTTLVATVPAVDRFLRLDSVSPRNADPSISQDALLDHARRLSGATDGGAGRWRRLFSRLTSH